MTAHDTVGRYQALLDVARSLGRVMELNTLLDEILRRSQQVMGAEACSIFLPDKQTGELIINSARGEHAPMLFAMRIPKGAGMAGSVFESRKTLNIKDAQNDPRLYTKVDAKTGFVTRCAITVPLLNGSECIGVLQAINAIGRDHFDDQDEAVCEAFSGLIVSAFLRLEAQERQIEEVRVKQELELASEIQKSFLPKNDLCMETCRVLMNYTPAKHIGGDFCFAYPCKNGRVLLGLGDVSGKGVPAALNMARATATIKATINDLDDDLGAWVTELNNKISADLYAGRFIGMTLIMADPNRQILHVCAAGQFPPFNSDGTSWKQPEALRQLPLGVLPGFRYTAQQQPLKRGDWWLLFSDGIAEARNLSGEEFGEQRFLQSLQAGSSSSHAFESAVAAWQNFVDGAPQHDDASILLLDWRGLRPCHRLEQTCQPSTLCSGREFVESWAQFVGYDDITTGQIVLAVDEAVTNIYRHAYGNQPGLLNFEAQVQDGSLVFTLEDQGKPVSPETIKGRSLDDVRPGGLGTVLLGKVFNRVEYHPHDHGTRLLLAKQLPSGCVIAS